MCVSDVVLKRDKKKKESLYIYIDMSSCACVPEELSEKNDEEFSDFSDNTFSDFSESRRRDCDCDCDCGC